MKLIIFISACIGIYQGFVQMQETYIGKRVGVKQSNSLLEFVFLNK